VTEKQNKDQNNLALSCLAANMIFCGEGKSYGVGVGTIG